MAERRLIQLGSIRHTNKNVISKMLYININKMFRSSDG